MLEACDPLWRDELNALCLVFPDGSDLVIPGGSFDDAFAALGSWIVGNGAEGNMAYILSRQLAATVLNINCGPLSDFTGFMVECDGGVIDLLDLISNADGLLCAFPNTPGNDQSVAEARAMQEALKNCFAGINENTLPLFSLSPDPCPFDPVFCP